jgi:hypothetical protein
MCQVYGYLSIIYSYLYVKVLLDCQYLSAEFSKKEGRLN